MTVDEIDLSEEVLENVRNSSEFNLLFDSVQEDYPDVSKDDYRAYNGQDDTVEQTVVFPFDNLEDVSFGSMAFGLENGEVTKASATLHFNHEADDKETKIRDYRYLHDDEEFYRPEDDKMVEQEHRHDGDVEVIEYYQEMRD